MRSPVLSPRQFEWTLLAFAATVSAHLLWLPAWYAAGLGALVLARWMQRRAFARAWPAWIKLPLVIALLVLVLAQFGNPLGQQAGTATLIGLLTLKLIESERRRDGLFAMGVALFLVSVQFLFTQGIGVTVYMLVPTLLIFLALNEVSAPPGTRGGLSSQLGIFGRDFLLLLLVVLPLTVFLFLSVPRLSEPLWGTRDDRSQARTGISDRMSPGDITQLIGDDTPVMRVTFTSQTPPKRSMYWRGPVLAEFDGTNWTPAELNLSQRQLTESLLEGPQAGSPGDLSYEVMLDPTDRRWLFTLDLATGFPSDSYRTLDGTVLRKTPVRDAYAFTAAVALDQPIPATVALEQQRRAGLELPGGLNPRTAALAQQWLAQVGPDPMALAQQALLHIRTEEFSYTLAPPPLVGAHRMDEFLFETRAGFCEHYAAAFVVLMRNAGVPARVVTGFLGGQFNEIGGYWLIRNSDAHAWAEILVDGRGWVRVDPTAAIAPERIDQSGAAFAGNGFGQEYEWLRALRDRADAIQAWWTRTVVRFDSLRQRDFFADVGIDPSNWRQMAGWMGAGLALFGVLTAAVFYLQRRRHAPDPARKLYQRFLKDLSSLGVIATDNEGATNLGTRAAQSLPDLTAPIQTLVAAYEQARYAPPSSDALPALRLALAAFRRELRARRS
jgi:protein-glutamine gamma-glutamyltransferase